MNLGLAASNETNSNTNGKLPFQRAIELARQGEVIAVTVDVGDYKNSKGQTAIGHVALLSGNLLREIDLNKANYSNQVIIEISKLLEIWQSGGGGAWEKSNVYGAFLKDINRVKETKYVWIKKNR